MNFLFHMILSGDDDQLLVGNFMGDFVKGRLENRFRPRIRQGVQLHRSIDSYGDRHPVYRSSRKLLGEEYGLYRGVMLDLFYDYFLVNNWSSWSDEPFDDYLVRTRAVMESHRDDLPEEMHRLLPIIFDELLTSYATIDGIGNALCRLSRRISRPNPLNGSQSELARNHALLEEHFHQLTPELFRFCAEIISSGDQQPAMPTAEKERIA